jgi:hypothetical protein
MDDDKRARIKVVGRQGEAKVDVVSFDPMQRAYAELRRGRPFIPKGVWKFKSFEEADEWLMKMLTRPRNRESQP